MFSFVKVCTILAAAVFSVECSGVVAPAPVIETPIIARTAPLVAPAHVGYAHAVPQNIPPYASQVSVVNRGLAAPYLAAPAPLLAGPSPYAAPLLGPSPYAYAPGPVVGASPYINGPSPYAVGPVVGPSPYAFGPAVGPSPYSASPVVGPSPYAAGPVVGPSPYAAGPVVGPSPYLAAAGPFPYAANYAAPFGGPVPV